MVYYEESPKDTSDLPAPFPPGTLVKIDQTSYAGVTYSEGGVEHHVNIARKDRGIFLGRIKTDCANVAYADLVCFARVGFVLVYPGVITHVNVKRTSPPSSNSVKDATLSR